MRPVENSGGSGARRFGQREVHDGLGQVKAACQLMKYKYLSSTSAVCTVTLPFFGS